MRQPPAPAIRRYSQELRGTVSLRPGLSVGTVEPESIYTAELNGQIPGVSNPARDGECEVLLPLPPQIISPGRPRGSPSAPGRARSVEIRGDKLVWFARCG